MVPLALSTAAAAVVWDGKSSRNPLKRTCASNNSFNSHLVSNLLRFFLFHLLILTFTRGRRRATHNRTSYGRGGVLVVTLFPFECPPQLHSWWCDTQSPIIPNRPSTLGSVQMVVDWNVNVCISTEATPHPSLYPSPTPALPFDLMSPHDDYSPRVRDRKNCR